MKWKHTAFQPIASAGHLSETLVKQLQDLHIETFEDLVALTRIESLSSLLHSCLNLTPDSFDGIFNRESSGYGLKHEWLLKSLTAEALKEMPFDCNEPTEAMIQELGIFQEQETAGDFFLTQLKAAQVNHIPDLLPIRSQGRRGTCVAFGAAAMREFLEKERCNLSEQYLYWSAKIHDGQENNPGTWIRFAMEALENEGVCLEKEWPYNSETGKTEHQGPPPYIAIKGAENFKITKKIAVNPKSVNDLRAVLLGQNGQKGRIISFAVPVFKSWHSNPITYKTGRIVMPLPGEDHMGGHCMCLVGFKDDPEWPGGGFFILRNSWGEKWGAECLYGAGYGTIAYKFISLYCWEAWTAEVDAKPLKQRERSRSHNKNHADLSSEKTKTAYGRIYKRVDQKSSNKILQGVLAVLITAIFGIASLCYFHFAGDQVCPGFEIICEKAFPGNNSLYHGHMEQGGKAFALREFQKAANAYSRALAIKPDDINALAMYGRSLYSAGDLPEAIRSFEKALNISGKEAGLHYEFGTLLFEAGNIDRAVQEWKNAFRLDPKLKSAGHLINRH